MNRHFRRGSVYLMVLGAALIVTIVGVSAVLAVRVRVSTVSQSRDFAVARHCAQAAIDVGMYGLMVMPDWRSRVTSGVWLDQMTLGDGSFSLQIEDPDDGDLGDDPADTVLLVGTGICNDARYSLKVLAAQPVQPLAALGTCLHAAGFAGVDWGISVRFEDAPLSSNMTVQNFGNITGDVECAEYFSWGSLSGSLDDDADPKDAPDSGVFAEYAAMATDITGVGDLVEGVLGPGYNTWGATNVDGVYYIDTMGGDLWIQKTRILGTLLVNTRGGVVHVSWGVHGSPARDDYPVLIVDGDLHVGMYSDTDLEESWRSINYNPPGVPYEGVTDDDTNDSYPAEFQGLIHATGDFETHGSTTLRGVVICEGDATFYEPLRIEHNSDLYDNPPLHYTTYGDLQTVPGSWEQVVEAYRELTEATAETIDP